MNYNNKNLILGITLFFASVSPLYAIDAGAFSIQFSDNPDKLIGELKSLESTLNALPQTSTTTPLDVNISMGNDQLKIIFNPNQVPIVLNNGVDISNFVNPKLPDDVKMSATELRKELSEVVNEIIRRVILDKQLKQEPNIINGSPASSVQKLINNDFDIAMRVASSTKTLSLDGALIGRSMPPPSFKMPDSNFRDNSFAKDFHHDIPREIPHDMPRDIDRDFGKGNIPSSYSSSSVINRSSSSLPVGMATKEGREESVMIEVSPNGIPIPVGMQPKESREESVMIDTRSSSGFQAFPKERSENFPKELMEKSPMPMPMPKDADHAGGDMDKGGMSFPFFGGDKNAPKPSGDADDKGGGFYKLASFVGKTPKDRESKNGESPNDPRGERDPNGMPPPDKESKDSKPSDSKTSENSSNRKTQSMTAKTKTTKDKKEEDQKTEESEKKPDLRSLEIRFGTLKSPGQKSNSTTIPFSLRRDLGNGKELIFKAPVTTVVTNGVKSQSVGSGISYKSPMSDNWSLVYSGNIGFINANQTATSARNFLVSISSTYGWTTEEREFYLTNMIGFSKTDNIKVSNVTYDGTLQNTIIRNGIVMAQPLNFFNNLLTVEYSIADTRYFGSETTMPNFQELGISWGTRRQKETKDTLRFGITYTHAKSAMGWAFNTGYSF